MLEAIYQGLYYGVIAGFSVFAFLLTGSIIWAAIEVIDHILDFMTARRQADGSKRGKSG